MILHKIRVIYIVSDRCLTVLLPCCSVHHSQRKISLLAGSGLNHLLVVRDCLYENKKVISCHPLEAFLLLEPWLLMIFVL